ncbi:acyltransferase family protein [Lentilactobacillus laojiaonis]|uniref:acyltransferase family protein n=1 Tax=Lentilactobacillus laojiaonis TaxID=2883998 RepID=UPI001D0B663D|nr:acyltransferase family protein [Lentilactobacillus laojiaonis]UDM32539.1 acyltransferase family protein [Lentilactobacillus laojiaonis]
MAKKRIAWIDIAKGLGIIAVAIGHALETHGTLYHFLYWWHMPIFFIAAGFFLKPVVNNDWATYLKKHIVPLLKSYFIFGVLLITFGYVSGLHSLGYTLRYFLKLLYGGTRLNLYLSVFWYMNVFIIASIVVTFIITYVKSRQKLIIIGFLTVITGVSYKHLELPFIPSDWNMPWDFDVSLLAIFFMLFGNLYFAQIKEAIRKFNIIIPITLIILLLIYGQNSGIFNFGFFMKSHIIHASQPISPTLAVTTIPIMSSIVIFSLSSLISRSLPIITWILTTLGKNTLFIMYLHKAILDITQRLGVDSIVLRLFIAIIVPCLLSLLYNYVVKKIKLRNSNNKVVEENYV